MESTRLLYLLVPGSSDIDTLRDDAVSSTFLTRNLKDKIRSEGPRAGTVLLLLLL